eukprot:CAMPEP_0174321776 /NCGR_PEP_ID=MMETSP0810-20121108/10552_1 /TAXON_ID=73025 ORGANISM="Eutreptiella gymnastica-like, Strain CCMP1594" /NCGR_SAMPLE_ID=MMETSP0810 /ASSEMBLY_ACC=CAM_ASM_000659 /LENGTH=86 /DNA_ID=CAMNT_0015433355 /DNA_START=817 /DNA_END=1074 /DNA_ORIENTATION=+
MSKRSSCPLGNGWHQGGRETNGTPHCSAADKVSAAALTSGSGFRNQGMRPRQRLQGPFVAEKCALTPGGKDTMPIPSKAAKQVQSD